MNGAIAIDHKLAELWNPFKPHRNLMEMSSPYKLTGHLSIPKPVISMVSNWLYSKEN
jgi:hypothetical protein